MTLLELLRVEGVFFFINLFPEIDKFLAFLLHFDILSLNLEQPYRKFLDIFEINIHTFDFFLIPFDDQVEHF